VLVVYFGFTEEMNSLKKIFSGPPQKGKIVTLIDIFGENGRRFFAKLLSAPTPMCVPE